MALLIGQSDKLVLGRVFTLGQFGLYGIALTIATVVLYGAADVSSAREAICAAWVASWAASSAARVASRHASSSSAVDLRSAMAREHDTPPRY